MRGVENKEAHLAEGAKAGASRSSGAAPKVTASNTNTTEVWCAMVDRIEKELCTKPITTEDKVSVRRIGELEPKDMGLFVQGLINACPPRKVDGASELDLDRMIMETRSKLRAFNTARKESFNTNAKKFYPHCVPDDVFVIETLPGLLDSENYVDYNENGSMLYYDDVKITVVNCKTAGAPFMKEWLENPENIYIGPADAFPRLINRDSAYFIPHDGVSMTRLIQNRKDIKRIIENIKQGKDDSSKYLALEGKTLGGVCVPYPCHSEVFIEVLRWLKNSASKKDRVNDDDLSRMPFVLQLPT